MEVDKWPRLAARLRELVGRGGLGGDLPVPIPVGGGGGGGRGVFGLAGGGRGRPAAGAAARCGCAHGEVCGRELVGAREAAAAAPGEVGATGGPVLLLRFSWLPGPLP